MADRNGEAQLTASQLRGNFWWMGTWFALNHGVVTTPLVVATTLLGTDVANIGNGTLYIVTLLSSLFLGAPYVACYGAKSGLMFGMLFYCVYVGCFAAAAYFKEIHHVAGLEWVLFVGGSAAGGLAAGVLWTAQGGYFAASATRIAEAEGVARETVTANLAGNFAFIYLGFEVLSKMGFTGLQKLHIPEGFAQGLGVTGHSLPTWTIGALYLALGVVALLSMVSVIAFPASGASVRPLDKVWAAASLWSDPIVWLLSPTNLTFGFCAAFMNGYVNSKFTAVELGKDWVAFMGAITAFVASILAKGFGPLAGKAGKGPVISIGASCFFLIPICLYVLKCCSGWGWWMISLYLLQGSGRAVYESTNRAMFSDFFPGSKTEGAFANCMLQASLSFALSFFLQNFLTGQALAIIVCCLAGLTPITFLGAKYIQKNREVLVASTISSPINVEAAVSKR